MAPPPSAPRLIEDLQVEERGDLVSVASPARGRRFLLWKAEWQVARQMDGRLTLPQLLRRARRAGMPAASLAQVEAFVRELGAYGLLRAAGPSGPEPRRFTPRGWPPRRQRRVRAALAALGRERYALARRLLERELKASPGCEELAAFLEGARRAEIDATCEQDEQWALAEAIREAGEGLALPGPRPVGYPPSPMPGPAPQIQPEVEPEADPIGGAAPAPEIVDHRPWRKRGIAAAVVGAALLAGAVIPLPYRITDDCQLEAARRARLRFAVAGRVEEVLAREGDRVEPGQVVARLARGELQRELELARARARLPGAGPGAREQAEAEARLLELRLAGTELRSPLGGLVATPDLEQRVGEQVQAGQELAEVVDRSELAVEVLVEEAQIDLIALGQPVRIRLRSLPDLELAGQVERIAPRVEEQRVVEQLKPRRFVRVRTTVPNPGGVLRPGMQGSARIEAGRMTLLRQVLRRVERVFRVSLFL